MSGIPTTRREMAEAGLPAPVFINSRNESAAVNLTYKNEKNARCKYTLYDLKIILKKSKPVLWYELEVPGGITFSALAVFLDIASGTKDAPPADYIFDLHSFEVQLREGIFEDGSYPLYKQALREADNTFIDEYMKKDSWFTYKPDKNEDTAFRIEVKETGSKMQIYPFPGRYSRGAWEFFEKDDRDAFKNRKIVYKLRL